MDLAKLKEPFPVAELNWRILRKSNDKQKAEVTAYIDARAVMDRLDEVCGPENWQNAYVAGPQGGVICRISIRVNDEWVTKEDGAENTDVEAIKGGISDAFKRAAVPWGIGRYLYELSGYWLPLKNEYGDFDPPIERLPAWAKPAGTARREAPARPASLDVTANEIDRPVPKEIRELATAIDESERRPGTRGTPEEEWKKLLTLMPKVRVTGPMIAPAIGGVFARPYFEEWLAGNESRTAQGLIDSVAGVGA